MLCLETPSMCYDPESFFRLKIRTILRLCFPLPGDQNPSLSVVQGLKANVSQILSSFLFMLGVQVQVQKHYPIMAGNRIALSNSFLKVVMLKYPYGIFSNH